ncbi:MAG: hypothetical protein ACQERC_02945 [Bacteroidota bacterium]
MGTFDKLIDQVDAFIKKYYKNLMIRGGLLFVLIFLISFLLVATLEYFGRFNSFVRAFLLFAFIATNAYVLIRYFAIPASKLLAFGKRINRHQAATIIGKFFPDVNDRLLITLQLHESERDYQGNVELLRASIQQNAQRLNAFSFTDAVDYGENRKYLKYVLPVILSVVLLGVTIPELFSDGSTRLMRYSETFVAEPNFEFELLNESLVVEEGSNAELEVVLLPRPGKSLPERVYLETDQGTYAMKSEGKNKAAFTLENVNDDVQFRFKGNEHYSSYRKLEVVKRTSLGNVVVDIDYPDYTQRKDEQVQNPGDIVVPYGSKLKWNGRTKHSDGLQVEYADTSWLFQEPGFRFEQRAVKSDMLSFALKNERLKKTDSIIYAINVVEDEYPSISVNERGDTTNKKKKNFSGNASDDYGLSTVKFVYEINKKDGSTKKEETVVPGISGKESPFSMTLDIRKLNLELDDELIYYFLVQDNDEIQGPKITKSKIYQYRAPSKEELDEQRNETKEDVEREMNEVSERTKEFQSKVKRLKKEMMNSKSSSYQQSKQMENLQKERESLEQKMKELRSKMQESFEEKEQLSEVDESIKQKQELLEELMEEVMDDELKELLDELEKLLEEQNDEDVMEKLEETEMTSEEMERQMDRTMEMLKKMDGEERAKDLQENLENLAEEQKNVKEELESNPQQNDDVQKKQKDLNEKFDDLKKNMEEMHKKNDQLKDPMELESLDEDAEKTKEDMENASENMEQKKNKEAGEKQDSAQKKMEEMASKLSAQLAKSQEKKKGEDIEAMRALLENLVALSFKQEQNMEDFEEVSTSDPYFVELGREQRVIMDNFGPVRDSLLALANRAPKAASFIEQELRALKKSYKYLPQHIGERENRELQTKQQKAMTHLNNLSLFINESLESAQKDMQSMKSGKGSCSKPGGKKGQGSKGEIQNMKEMLKKQLEKMKKGSQPGGDKKGKQPGKKNSGGMLPMDAKGAAKMSAEQDEMRRKLQQLREEMNKDGSGDGNKLNELIDELEQQQEDLINKKWDGELIERQNKIMTRLLESEKALRERGYEEERESNSGKNEDFSNQIEFLEYKKQKEKQIELLRTLDPSFSRYYKDKANAYFLDIN